MHYRQIRYSRVNAIAIKPISSKITTDLKEINIQIHSLPQDRFHPYSYRQIQDPTNIIPILNISKTTQSKCKQSPRHFYMNVRWNPKEQSRLVLTSVKYSQRQKKTKKLVASWKARQRERERKFHRVSLQTTVFLRLE